MLFPCFYIFCLLWPFSLSSICFVDNGVSISTQDGTFENPFSDIMSALNLIINQNNPQNFIIFSSSNNITELSGEIQVQNELTIKSLNVEESTPSYGRLIFLNDTRLLISSTLNILNLKIIILSQNIESLFILLVGATINFQVVFFFKKKNFLIL